MKLRPLNSNKTNPAFEIRIMVSAGNEAEAAQMQLSLQSFVNHFSVAEMKRASEKLKNPVNRKLIKTFL